MLQTNVSQMLKGPIGTERNVDVDDMLYLPELGESHVAGKLKFTRTDRSILVKGALKLNVEIDCVRCLDRFTCPLEFVLEEEFFPLSDVSSGKEIDEQLEDDTLVIDEHMQLDISEAIRQYTIMSLPMKPLCRVDCTGLATG